MKYHAKIGDEEREFEFEQTANGLVARSGDRTYDLDLSRVDDSLFSLLVDGRSYDVAASLDGHKVELAVVGERFVVEVEDERERAAMAVAGNKASGKQELRAAMPGIVVDVKVEPGAEVEPGQALVVLEAMKMQNPLCAESAGKVVRVLCETGDAVTAGALLVELE